jgi:hypothetical protein
MWLPENVHPGKELKCILPNKRNQLEKATCYILTDILEKAKLWIQYKGPVFARDWGEEF